MFGLGTFSELRVALLGVLLAAVAASYVYVHHEGYEACRSPEKAADKAQVEKDLTDAEGTIDDLKKQLSAIPPAQPPPVLRLCPQPRSVRASPATGGAEPPVAGGTGASPPGMLAGDTGFDAGPSLSDSKRAAEVLAIYADETREWAIKQSAH